MDRNRRGWTLVEVLIVVVLVLILSGIVWAVLQPARDRALQTTCIQKMRQIWIALENYRQDYGGIDPPAAKNSVEAGFPMATYDMLSRFKAGYVKRFREGFHCPTHRIPSGYLSILQQNPKNGCPFPCFDRQGNLTTCDFQNCAEYQFGLTARDLPSGLESSMAEAARRHLEREDALFRVLAQNYPILYDEGHNPQVLVERPSDRFLYLFIHLDGHASRKVTPPILDYFINLYEEHVGGD